MPPTPEITNGTPDQKDTYEGYVPFNTVGDSFDLVERVDVSKLRKITANLEKLSPIIFKDYDDKSEVASTTSLIKRYTRLACKHNGKVPIHYLRKDVGKRYQVQGVGGLQGLPRLIRHSISSEFYFDLDMANCHYVLLENYCRIHAIPCPEVSHYIKNREEVLSELVKSGRTRGRDHSKKLLLALLNYISSAKEDDPPFLCRLREEMKRIHRVVMEREPAFLAKSVSGPKASYNLGGSVFNKLLISMEVDMVTSFKEFLEMKGCSVEVVVHDGIQIRKIADDKVEQLMREAEEWVLARLGWRVKFTCKKMDENALDLSQYNDEWFDEFDRRGLILKKKKRDRSAEELEFLAELKKREGKKAALQVSAVSEKHETRVKADRWIDPGDLDLARKCAVIRGGLGIGKSTACLNHLRARGYPRAVVLTPRRSFASGVATKLREVGGYDFKFYLDCDDYAISDPHVVVQAESLHRLSEWKAAGCVVIIDEVESFLTQLTSGLDKHQVESVTTLLRILDSARKVVCLDAFVSDRTLDWLTDLKIPFDYFHYTRKLGARTFEEMSYVFEGAGRISGTFLPSLADSLNEGKKVYFVCSSLSQWRNAIKKYITWKCPGKIILEYHSRKKSTKLKDVMEEWKGADLVMTTTTITVGLDYNYSADSEFAFDRMYVFLSAASQNLVRDVAQGMYRPRALKENHLVFAMDENLFDKGRSLPYSRAEVKRDVEAGGRVAVEVLKADPFVFNSIEKTPPFFKKLVVANLFERTVSQRYIREQFMFFLEQCNYGPVQCGDDDAAREAVVGSCKEFKELDLIRSIGQAEFNRLERLKKSGGDLSDDEFWEVKYYRFRLYFGNVDENADSTYKLWLYFVRRGNLRIRQLLAEKKIVSKRMEAVDCFQREKYVESADSVIARVYFIREITRILGLPHSQSFGAVVPWEKLMDAIPFLREHKKTIFSTFSLRDRDRNNLTISLKRGVSIINAILSAWGFSKLVVGKQIRIKVNGKWVRRSSYILEEIVVEVLESEEFGKIKITPHVYEALNVRKKVVIPRSVPSVPSVRVPEVTPEIVRLFVSYYLLNRNFINNFLDNRATQT